MEDQRVIPKESGEAVANANDALFLETSAKSNINIDEAFERGLFPLLRARAQHRHAARRPCVGPSWRQERVARRT